MKSLLAAAFIFVLAACAIFGLSPENPEKALAVQLTFSDGGLCSGTPIAKRAILTAAHCVDADGDGRADPAIYRSMNVDGTPTTIREIIDDGNDHAIIVTDMKYSRHAEFGPLPKVGDKVHLYGNPGGIEDLYREGEYIGFASGVYLYDMNIWHGDSGSGILDTHGRIVGVTTGYIIDHNPFAGSSFRVGIALPFAFSQAELDRAGIDSIQPAVLQLDL